MQYFTTYRYIIDLSEVVQVLSDAIEKGYTPNIVINGEYYDIRKEGQKEGRERGRKLHLYGRLQYND